MITTIDRYSAPKYNWAEVCESFVLLDNAGLSVKQEVMPPGSREKLHVHSRAQQFFYMLKGSARFTVSGQIIDVQQNQGLHVSPGKQHRIENLNKEVIEFLVISQPAIVTDRVNIE